jgi:hypothetical protein
LSSGDDFFPKDDAVARAARRTLRRLAAGVGTGSWHDVQRGARRLRRRRIAVVGVACACVLAGAGAAASVATTTSIAP